MILGLGVGYNSGIQFWLHLSSLGFTIEMCMCIYTQSSIKLCKASPEGDRFPSVLDCFVWWHWLTSLIIYISKQPRLAQVSYCLVLCMFIPPGLLSVLAAPTNFWLHFICNSSSYIRPFITGLYLFNDLFVFVEHKTSKGNATFMLKMLWV